MSGPTPYESQIRFNEKEIEELERKIAEGNTSERTALKLQWHKMRIDLTKAMIEEDRAAIVKLEEQFRNVQNKLVNLNTATRTSEMRQMKKMTINPGENYSMPGFEDKLIYWAVKQLTDEETQGIPRDILLKAFLYEPGHSSWNKFFYGYSTPQDYKNATNSAIQYMKVRILDKIPEWKRDTLRLKAMAGRGRKSRSMKRKSGKSRKHRRRHTRKH